MVFDNNKHLDIPYSQTLLDDIPLPLHVYQPAGMLVATNRTADEFWGIPREELVNKFNAFANPQFVDPALNAYFDTVLHGEVVIAPPVLIDTTRIAVARTQDIQRWIGATYFPFHNDMGVVSHIVMMNHDATEQIQQALAMEAVQQEVASQRETIRALSTPIIQVWDGVLTVPLVGEIDSRRATAITESLLEAIVRHQADIVLLDVTGVPIPDAVIVNYLISAARACRLIGSDVVLVGISPLFAHSIVQLNIDLSGIETKTNLQAGIAWAFRRRGLQVVKQRNV